MATIVFIHGLNTYGDEDLHVGPLRFGPMHSRWESTMRKRGLDFLAVSELVPGPPLEQAKRISAQMRNAKLPEHFHLLGHSTGGLVARAIAVSPEWRERIASVMTVGTPNQGARAAEFGLAFAEKYAHLHRLFAIFGYDTLAKRAIYKSFTPAAIAEFGAMTSEPEARQFSFVCEVPREAISWPLAALHGRLNPEKRPGDGFIESSSQIFGEVRGVFSLDHFGGLGFFPFFSPFARRRAVAEFSRLADAVAATAREVDENATNSLLSVD